MRAEHHRWRMARPASASAAVTTNAASHVISERSARGMARSMIERNASGGTSARTASATMAARNTRIVPRYG
ncbi:MAG: hypothetical protein V9E89_07915 [Ilumatobacteraceae bacterium]